MAITIERPKAVAKRRGKCRTAHYDDIKKGLFPRPIRLGLRAVGHPSHETDAILAAQIAGKSDDEIRNLVRNLIAERKNLA